MIGREKRVLLRHYLEQGMNKAVDRTRDLGVTSPYRERGGAMIGREKRVLLRHYLEQGMNKAVIARDLGVSRRTVYQVDRDRPTGPRVGRRACRGTVRDGLMPSKLDPYKPLIDTRLKEYAKLTAVRLFKEVRAAGYPGSYNQVKRYVRKVRPRPPEEPVVRFETAPGRQGQVDFAHCGASVTH